MIQPPAVSQVGVGINILELQIGGEEDGYVLPCIPELFDIFSGHGSWDVRPCAQYIYGHRYIQKPGFTFFPHRQKVTVKALRTPHGTVACVLCVVCVCASCRRFSSSCLW